MGVLARVFDALGLTLAAVHMLGARVVPRRLLNMCVVLSARSCTTALIIAVAGRSTKALPESALLKLDKLPFMLGYNRTT